MLMSTMSAETVPLQYHTVRWYILKYDLDALNLTGFHRVLAQSSLLVSSPTIRLSVPCHNKKHGVFRSDFSRFNLLPRFDQSSVSSKLRSSRRDLDMTSLLFRSYRACLLCLFSCCNFYRIQLISVRVSFTTSSLFTNIIYICKNIN